MSKEDKPLEYQRRLRDTKGVAQRLDLGYLNRSALILLLRRRATWALVGLAGLASVPLVMGIGSSRKTLESRGLSEAHALFEKRCEVCHMQAFAGVPDKACLECHDGAPHPAKLADSGHPTTAVRCGECHMEHRGKTRLSAVGNGNCTSCHADIAAHSTGAKVRNVSAFRPDRHPEFSTVGFKDLRPLRLNHAIHMPADAKVIRGIRLPMKCGDCHVVDHNSPTGQLLPVTFEQNCKSCHARELEFDVDHVVSPPVPAPHAKDTKVIHEFIWNAFAVALKANPGLARRPVGNDLAPLPSANAWMERVVKDAEMYLFGRKCGYCHRMKGGGEVTRVGEIAGRYVDESSPKGAPWLMRGEFAHRSHRALECESCHTQAPTSTQTADVLIPVMKTCTPCHGESGTSLDDCARCHQYHNRSLEKDRAPGKLGGLAGRPAAP